VAVGRAGLGAADALAGVVEQQRDQLVRIGFRDAGGDPGAAVLVGEVALGGVHGGDSSGVLRPVADGATGHTPVIGGPGHGLSWLPDQSLLAWASSPLSELARPCSCTIMLSMAVNCAR